LPLQPSILLNKEYLNDESLEFFPGVNIKIVFKKNAYFNSLSPAHF
jgi:hypothetical protein